MSLDLSVLMKERLTRDRLGSFHEFLIKEKSAKERMSPFSFFYFSPKPSISIDVFLIKAPLKGNALWQDLSENGERAHFVPKSAITMESRHTEASHLKAYSLGKALARRFGGIIYDHQMSTVYNARGRAFCDPEEKQESPRYGAAIAPFMNALADLMQTLGARQAGKKPRSEVILEHLGLMADAKYFEKWEEKVRQYEAAGTKYFETNEEEIKTLVATVDRLHEQMKTWAADHFGGNRVRCIEIVERLRRESDLNIGRALGPIEQGLFEVTDQSKNPVIGVALLTWIDLGAKDAFPFQTSEPGKNKFPGFQELAWEEKVISGVRVALFRKKA